MAGVQGSSLADQSRLTETTATAIAKRRDLLDAEHLCAARLFNGFSEGRPDLVIDLYGKTAVFHIHAASGALGDSSVAAALTAVRSEYRWVETGLVKARNGVTPDERRGILVFGNQLTDKICEHGIWYALDLTLHQDCSFYLDTRELRHWAIRHLAGKSVLNAFAYTGSLGVAALRGGAERVIQLDRNNRFLNLARASSRLNGFPVDRQDFVRADFFRAAGGMRRRGEVFDCVFLDPPFFSTTEGGTVNLENESGRLINKVRPLVAHGGWLVAINNALYVSGASYMRMLESLCSDGYLEVEELIPVPLDVTGFGAQDLRGHLVDPTPFNHPTKIAVLRVR